MTNEQLIIKPIQQTKLIDTNLQLFITNYTLLIGVKNA